MSNKLIKPIKPNESNESNELTAMFEPEKGIFKVNVNFKIDNNENLIIKAKVECKNDKDFFIYERTYGKEEIEKNFKIKVKDTKGISEETKNNFKNKDTEGIFEDTEKIFKNKDTKGIFEDIVSSCKEKSLTLDFDITKVILYFFMTDNNSNKRERKHFDIPPKISKSIKAFRDSFLLYEKTSKKLNLFIRIIPKISKILKILSNKKSTFSGLFNQHNKQVIQKLAEIEDFICQKQEEKKKVDFVVQSVASLCLKSPRVQLMETQLIKTIQNNDTSVNSICLLKDGRLVSCDYDIVVYKKGTYESEIRIENPHNAVYTICGLSNGMLASGGCSNSIKIWNIDNSHEPIHELEGHKDSVFKIIELNNKNLCSCSGDRSVKVWDGKKYECIYTLAGHTSDIKSIMEINNCIISLGKEIRDGMRIWEKTTDKTTFKVVKAITNVSCFSENGISNLNNSKILIGGRDELFIIDAASSFEVNSFKDKNLGDIESICVLRDGKVLIGNSKGMLIYFDPSSNKIIKTTKIQDKRISWLIEGEDNKLFTCSQDQNINVYNLTLG